MKTTTKFQIDLQFSPVQSAEAVLNELYAKTSSAIDQHNLINGYCNMHIKVSKKAIVFAQVAIDAVSSDVQYFVAFNPQKGDYLPALSYTQAVRELRNLMV